MVDRQVAVVQARTLPDLLDRVFYAQPRFSLLVLGIFAVTGTLLVGVGVFSVMAYTVSVQRKEIAVRVALGASRAHSGSPTTRRRHDDFPSRRRRATGVTCKNWLFFGEQRFMTRPV